MKYVEIMDEDPVYDGSEMPQAVTGEFFLSLNTLQDEFLQMEEFNIFGRNFVSVMHDEQDYAVLGEIGNRSVDQKPGIFIDCQLTFKRKVDDEFAKAFGDKETLQVDLVTVNARPGFDIERRRGLGYYLYRSIIREGITLVGDYLQYKGGRALWIKIANLSANDGFSVFVFKNGDFMKDSNGQPIKYDGANIPDEEIWSVDETNKRVLLVARKNG